MNKAFARLRRDEGDTLVSVMGAMIVGAIVLALAAAFWVNSGKGANRNADVSQQQAAALRVVNSIVGDVNKADSIVYASPTTLVTERQVVPASGAASTVRTRYTYKTKDIVKTTRTNAPAGAYNEATTFGATSPNLTNKIVATRATSSDMFKYFAMDSAALPTGVLAAGDLAKVKRVDISFKADAGKGYVELKTKAAVNKKRSTADGDDPAFPGLQCPVAPTLVNSGGNVTVTWNVATDVEQYFVVRNNVKIGPIPASALSGTKYTWVDTSPIVGAVNTYAIEVRAGADFRSCAASTISIPLATPSASGVVDSSNAFNITWATVPGATGYRVYYREVSNANYGAPKAWSNQAVTGTSLTLDEGGNAAREFYVQAIAGSITSDPSPKFVMLSAPNPPDLTLQATNYNVNRLTIPGIEDNLEMGSYRRANGGPLASESVTLLDASKGVYDDGLDTTFGSNSGFSQFKAGDDQQYLGYDYDYKAYVRNTGPRSSAEWFGKSPAVWAAGGTGTGRNSSATSGWKSVKQFPADPVSAVATGSEANAVGTNKVTWSPARGASTYEVFRTWGNKYGSYESNDGDRFWSTGAATSFTDTNGAKRGTRHFYMPIAVNSTGLSPARVFGSQDRAAAFQKPEAPKVDYNFGKRPSLDTNIKAGTNKPLGNYYEVDWSFDNGNWSPDYPQQNQPAAYPFCDGTTDVCKYVSKVNGTVTKTAPHTDKAFTATATNWGVKDDLKVSACNPGGCDEGSKDVLTYPGPFDMTDFELEKQTMYVYQRNGTMVQNRQWRWGHTTAESLGAQDTDFAGTKIGWSKSQGAAKYTALRGQFNGYWWDWGNQKTVSANVLTGDYWTAAPSTTYRMSVYSESAFDSNLKRSVNGPQNEAMNGFDQGLNFATLQTSPLPPARMDNRKKCYRNESGSNKGDVNPGRYGSRVAYADSTWNATTDGFQTYTPIDRIGHYATYGRVPETYLGSSWTTDQGTPWEKLVAHSAPRLNAMEAGGAATSTSRKWAHNYKETPYGPRSEGTKDAFGFHVEDVDIIGSQLVRNYVAHQVDSRLALTADAGDGKSAKYLNIDYQPVSKWADLFVGECAYGFGYVPVADGGSIQRHGTPTQVLATTTIPQASIPTSRYYYYLNQGGPVVGFPNNEQPYNS